MTQMSGINISPMPKKSIHSRASINAATTVAPIHQINTESSFEARIFARLRGRMSRRRTVPEVYSFESVMPARMMVKIMSIPDEVVNTDMNSSFVESGYIPFIGMPFSRL